MFTESDQYDKLLDELAQKVVNGGSISIEDWLDAMDGLEDTAPEEPPTAEEVRAATEARTDFLNWLRDFGFSLENRFKLCEDLYAHAVTQPSGPLRRLYCEIASDTGFLLDLDREDRTAEQDALCWRRQSASAEKIEAFLQSRQDLYRRFRETIAEAEKAPNPGTKGDFAEQARQIADAYGELFQKKSRLDILARNLTALLQTAEANPPLRTLKPLFLYRVLTRHSKRLQKSEDIQLDYHALWQYQQYQIDSDNGKNFKSYGRFLGLFAFLCDQFREEGGEENGADIPLCLYGFDQLSNLGEYYRNSCEETETLDFGPQIEDIFLECPFFCFEHGSGDNVLMEETGITRKMLQAFTERKGRSRSAALRKIGRYMAARLPELIHRFTESSPEKVKLLCAEILACAGLTKEQAPRDTSETTLFLAAINHGLMSNTDNWAEDYLIRAGKALCGEDLRHAPPCPYVDTFDREDGEALRNLTTIFTARLGHQADPTSRFDYSF